MPTKQCSKCGEMKDTSEFFKDTRKNLRKRSKDGFVSSCKTCHSAYEREYNKREYVRDAYRKHTKEWKQTPEGRAYIAKYIISDKNRERNRRYKKSEKGKLALQHSAERHPDRKKIISAVRHTIYSGVLPRISTLSCIACGNPATEYHHHNGYAPEYWLDVVPMCHTCHQKETNNGN